MAKREVSTMKNSDALAVAYKITKDKIKKIRSLGLDHKLTDAAKDKTVIALAKAKAIKEETEDWKQFLKGYEWYVGDLISFANLDGVEAQLDLEYQNSFPSYGSESELIASLKQL